MKSDVIVIRNDDEGRERALSETERTAVWCALSPKKTLQARLIAEEMMGMIHSISGEIDALFWIESSGTEMEFVLTTDILMNAAARNELVETSTSRENEAAKTFLGHLRDFFERAMLSGAGSYVFAENVNDIPLSSMPAPVSFDPELDHYERSILKNVADQIRIFIRGNRVEMHVFKEFGKS